MGSLVHFAQGLGIMFDRLGEGGDVFSCLSKVCKGAGLISLSYRRLCSLNTKRSYNFVLSSPCLFEGFLSLSDLK